MILMMKRRLARYRSVVLLGFCTPVRPRGVRACKQTNGWVDLPVVPTGRPPFLLFGLHLVSLTGGKCELSAGVAYLKKEGTIFPGIVCP